MDAYSEILAHTQRYCSDLNRVLEARRPGDGLFGLGNDPRNHPCHTTFYEAVANTLTQAQSQALSEAETDKIVSLVLHLDEEHRALPEMARLMLQAVQGLVLPLIPRGSVGCAAELSDWYARAYPRQSRLPNQSKVLRALNRRAGRGLLHRR